MLSHTIPLFYFIILHNYIINFYVNQIRKSNKYDITMAARVRP